jgi:hypothetical protein
MWTEFLRHMPYFMSFTYAVVDIVKVFFILNLPMTTIRLLKLGVMFCSVLSSVREQLRDKEPCVQQPGERLGYRLEGLLFESQ